jgi:hypothetical protein
VIKTASLGKGNKIKVEKTKASNHNCRLLVFLILLLAEEEVSEPTATNLTLQLA